eukprot:COSAG02_NODE_9450_length_2212_cov_2.791765_1_plen_67_part_00
MVATAAAADLPARVRIIAEDVQDALDLLQLGTARARMRGEPGRTGAFSGKISSPRGRYLPEYWYRH